MNSSPMPSESNTKPYVIAILTGLAFLGLWFLRQSKKVKEGVILNEDATIGAVKKLGQTQFNRLNFSLSYNEQKTELSAKESDLLEFLAKHLNERVEKDKILKAVWGDDGDYVGRTLDVFISKLRKKLAVDKSIRIVNIRGIGYQLVVEEA
jgi:DNA-binding response OmpR family regulator